MASRSYTYSGRNGASKKSTQDLPTAASPAYTAQVLGIKKVKSTTPVPTPPKKSQPRKRKARSPTPDEEDDDEEDPSAAAESREAMAGIGPSKPKRARKGDEVEEKRLRRFRPKAPATYLERLERVRCQRMFLIDRQRHRSEDGMGEEEKFDIAGSTGNIYQVTIGKVPRCTCPDASKGNQCKHIIYVMVNVLKAPENLAYQLALLSTEVAEIFASAPVTPQSSDAAPSTVTDTGGSRKPIEGDCPVCVMEFDERDKSEDILWCKGACGNNIHRHCFEQWAKSKPGTAKCVYCRTPWKGDGDNIKRRISKGGAGKVNEEGYVNVAEELGISGENVDTEHMADTDLSTMTAERVDIE
ncbi:hypothetical protein LZ554_007551 [Drepanopeziza brunnea f. sp. 'monogermtubi']|nr:hypothetical protein LZ554_007551 [Drepanopeziza brunnea f. sp. 'monogermtubi']